MAGSMSFERVKRQLLVFVVMDATQHPHPRVRQTRGEEKRRRILIAAQDLLQDRGMSAVTHRAVATLAGVPTSSIRYYFSSREDLLLACLDDFEERRTETVTKVLAEEPTRESFPRDFLRVWIGPHLDDESLVAALSIYVDSLRESPLLAERLRHHRLSAEADLAALCQSCGMTDLDLRLATAVCDGVVIGAGLERLEGVADLAMRALQGFLRNCREDDALSREDTA